MISVFDRRIRSARVMAFRMYPALAASSRSHRVSLPNLPIRVQGVARGQAGATRPPPRGDAPRG